MKTHTFGLSCLMRHVGVAILAIFFGFGGHLAFAGQAPPAAIRGTVTDSTQSVVVGAQVAVDDQSAGTHLRAATDREGRYSFSALRPGTYVVTVTVAGFTPASKRLTVLAGESRVEDIALAPAAVSETVTVGFTGTADRTTLKYDVPVRDLPVAVTSYTDTFMRAISARRTDELFPYMTGVTRADNTAYDFTVRGVRAREPNNMLVDGMPGLPARFGSPTLADVDHVELLRGPASVQYGQIQPGGVVNLITKRPTAERLNSIGVRYGAIASGIGGTPTVGRAEGDLSGRVDASAHWLYRLTFSYDDNGSFRQNVDQKGLFVSPALTWVPNPRTVVEASMTYRRERLHYDDGLVAPGNDISKVAPIQVRYQEPNDSMREDGGAATVRVTRTLTPRTTWSTSLRSVIHNDYRHEYENVQVARDLVTLQRRDREQRNARRYDYVDTSVKTTRDTGFLTHALIAGFNGGYELRSPNMSAATASPTLNVNLYHPVFGAPRPPVVAGTFRRDNFVNAAGYVQDYVTLSRSWKALAAIRYDSQHAVYKDMRGTGGRTTNPSAWSPLAGLVFEPGSAWSLYGNFSTSFAPPNPEAEDANGQNNFLPERGRQTEIGSKWTRLNGRIDARAAAYRIVRRNVLQVLGGGITAQRGEERSQGAELEGHARMTGGLQVIAGYAYTDAKVSRDATPINVGSRVPNVAKHSANAWLRYDVRSGVARDLGLGVGLVYRGDRAGSPPLPTASALLLPGYLRTDAGVYYKHGRYDVTLQAVNLTNRVYYESARSAIGIMPGSPRQLLVSLRTRF